MGQLLVTLSIVVDLEVDHVYFLLAVLSFLLGAVHDQSRRRGLLKLGKVLIIAVSKSDSCDWRITDGHVGTSGRRHIDRLDHDSDLLHLGGRFHL